MPEAEKEDIKEILEVLSGLKVVGVAAAGILGDGKLSVADIEKFIKLATSFDVLKDAVEGADEVVREAKDLDQSESVVLLAAVFSLVKAIKDAAKEAKAQA